MKIAETTEETTEEMEPRSRVGGQNYSPWVSVFNMCNAAIGSGVLSFPFAFRYVCGGDLMI